jgi:hypothetical protein
LHSVVLGDARSFCPFGIVVSKQQKWTSTFSSTPSIGCALGFNYVWISN